MIFNRVVLLSDSTINITNTTDMHDMSNSVVSKNSSSKNRQVLQLPSTLEKLKAVGHAHASPLLHVVHPREIGSPVFGRFGTNLSPTDGVGQNFYPGGGGRMIGQFDPAALGLVGGMGSGGGAQPGGHKDARKEVRKEARRVLRADAGKDGVDDGAAEDLLTSGSEAEGLQTQYTIPNLFVEGPNATYYQGGVLLEQLPPRSEERRRGGEGKIFAGDGVVGSGGDEVVLSSSRRGPGRGLSQGIGDGGAVSPVNKNRPEGDDDPRPEHDEQDNLLSSGREDEFVTANEGAPGAAAVLPGRTKNVVGGRSGSAGSGVFPTSSGEEHQDVDDHVPWCTRSSPRGPKPVLVQGKHHQPAVSSTKQQVDDVLRGHATTLKTQQVDDATGSSSATRKHGRGADEDPGTGSTGAVPQYETLPQYETFREPPVVSPSTLRESQDSWMGQSEDLIEWSRNLEFDEGRFGI